MTANRPLSPTRRPPPRRHAAWVPASHSAQNTQPPCRRPGTSEPAQVHTSSPDVRTTPDSRVKESAPSPARRPPVGAPEHEGHPVTFSLPPRRTGLFWIKPDWRDTTEDQLSGEKATDGKVG